MMCKSRCSVVAFVAVLAPAVPGQGEPPPTSQQPRHMMARGYYFREPVDQDWEIRVIGQIPSLPGCYYILHDADGRLMLKRHVPHGVYTRAKPFVIRFPRDRKTGDYKLVVLGQQEDLLGPRMPISTLPYEVYGRTYFTAGHNDTALFFTVPEGVTKRNIRGYKGNIRVYEGDKLVADAKKDGKLAGYDWSVDFPVEAGKFYWVERKCFYFRSSDGLLLVFDRKRWFVPDPKLDDHQWWELKE